MSDNGATEHPRERGTGAAVTYNGPTFHGDVKGVQMAWNNTNVIQNQAHSEHVAPGFEDVARAVADVLRRLAELGLSEQEERDAAENANMVLAEATRPRPDRTVIRRGVTAIKGTLAQLAAGLVRGATDGSAELAKELVDALGQPLV